jgi:hypothetical protein
VRIEPDDIGFQLGDVVFEYARTFNGKPFTWEEHVKTGSQGTKEFTYGYKLHLLVDCESELPMAANVSAGNVHDSQRTSNVLGEARKTNGKFRPRYVLADKGYSGRKLHPPDTATVPRDTCD